jgi:hypothetical protein
MKLSKKESDFNGLTESQKIDLKKMFNEYLVDLINMGCNKAKAIIIAKQKVEQNYKLAIQCYK